MKIAAPLSCPVRRVRVRFRVRFQADMLSENLLKLSARQFCFGDIQKLIEFWSEKVPRVGKLGWEQTAVSIQSWVPFRTLVPLLFLGIQLTPQHREEPQRLEGVRVFCSILQLVRKLSFVPAISLPFPLLTYFLNSRKNNLPGTTSKQKINGF